MGMSEKMGSFATKMQDGAKTTASSIVLLLLKLVSAAFLGLTLGLIVRELLGNGILTLLFVMFATMFAFMKVAAAWSFGQLFIFDLICILVGMLLRMYIVIAP